MEQIYKDRLLKLADHLESGVLGHKVFDFTELNSFDGYKTLPYQCGTKGCALGECPIVFPEDWMFNWESTPALRGSYYTIFPAASEFFKISLKEADWLFIPADDKYACRCPTWYQLTDAGATPQEVAANIRRFVEFKNTSEG